MSPSDSILNIWSRHLPSLVISRISEISGHFRALTKVSTIIASLLAHSSRISSALHSTKKQATVLTIEST